MRLDSTTSVFTAKLRERVPGIAVEMDDSVVKTEPKYVEDKTYLLSVVVLVCSCAVDVVNP